MQVEKVKQEPFAIDRICYYVGKFADIQHGS